RLQNRHFLDGPFADPYYAARRKNIFLVAVHCTHPADTCFCASTGDGPRATQDFDIALSELDDGYLVQAGSDKGSAITAQLPVAPATDAQRHIAEQEVQEAARRQ